MQRIAMTRQKIIFTALAIFAFIGCTNKDEPTNKINSITKPEVCISYGPNNTLKPVPAKVVATQGVGLAPSAIEVIVYETSLTAGYGVLQVLDPKFNLRTVPGQKLTLKLSDTNETNVTYVFNNRYPFSFRENDDVIIDTNGTDVMSIRILHSDDNQTN